MPTKPIISLNPLFAPHVFALNDVGWVALNATDDAMEFIVQAPEAVTIDRVQVYVITRTGTQPTWRVSVQGVDATGRADGAIKSAGNAYGDLTAAATGVQTVTLGASYAVARGEFFAVRIAPSGAGQVPDASNNTGFVYQHNAMALMQFPCAVTVDGGVATRRAGPPAVAWGDAGSLYGWLRTTTSTTNVTSTGAVREFGNRFTLPAGVGSYQVLGARLYVGGVNASADFDLLLYEGGGASDFGTVLQSVAVDASYYSSFSQTVNGLIWFDEATLAGGGTYRLVVRAATANAVQPAYTDQPDAANLAMAGMDAAATQRGTGDWSETANRVAHIEPIVAAIQGGGGNVIVVVEE